MARPGFNQHLRGIQELAVLVHQIIRQVAEAVGIQSADEESTKKPDGQTAYPALAQIAASLLCAVRSGMSDRLKKAENRGIRGKWFSMAYFCDILTNWKSVFG